LGLAAALGIGSASAQEAPREPVDQARLAEFLVQAKRAGYASGDTSRIRSLKDGGAEVTFSDGDLSYRGRWYGGTSFTGQEIVWRQGRPVWALNFYGANCPGTAAPHEEFTKFHKSALRRVEAASPFRGPAMYREGRFAYVTEVSGSLKQFRGTERVFFDDVEVYRMEFHGGLTDR
jgi:uncharacterized protein YodC (DUF2158 family)